MRYGLVAVTAGMLACASSGNTPPASESSSVEREGIYEYVANLPGQQVRGKMMVLADTVTLEPVADYCRATLRPPDPLAYHFTCNGPGSFEQLTFTIGRRNPAQLSNWRASYRVQRQREVCVRYETRDGRQVCVQTQRETYEVTESRSGRLQVRRLSS